MHYVLRGFINIFCNSSCSFFFTVLIHLYETHQLFSFAFYNSSLTSSITQFRPPRDVLRIFIYSFLILLRVTQKNNDEIRFKTKIEFSRHTPTKRNKLTELNIYGFIFLSGKIHSSDRQECLLNDRHTTTRAYRRKQENTEPRKTRKYFDYEGADAVDGHFKPNCPAYHEERKQQDIRMKGKCSGTSGRLTTNDSNLQGSATVCLSPRTRLQRLYSPHSKGSGVCDNGVAVRRPGQ